MLVSFYPDSVTTAGQTLELPEVLAGIRDGRWRTAVEAARAALGDKAAYARAKRRLPGFTTSGTFSAREDGKLLHHSGLLCLDIDAKDANAGVDLVAARRAIETDSYAYAVGTSTGGVGFFVLVPIPAEDHKGSFRALAAYFQAEYGVAVDPSCSNVSRLRFVSYDPALCLNEQAATFEETLPEPRAKQPVRMLSGAPFTAPDLRNADTEATLIAIGVKMIQQAPEGGKHDAVRDAAHMVGGYVGSGFVDAGRAYDALLSAVLAKENVADLKNAEKSLHSGLYKTGPAKPLLPEWLQLRVRKELREARQAYGTVVTLAQEIATQAHVPLASVQAAIEALAKEQQQSPTLLTFWYLQPPTKRDGPAKVQLSDNDYKNWLAAEGFRKYRIGEASYLIVRVQANIVHRQDGGQLRDFVNAYLDNLPYEFDGGVYRFQIQNLVLAKDGKYYDPKFLQNLPSLDQPFLRDEREQAYFFFTNCWVRVSATERQALPYAELPGLIWTEQVRPHHVVLISRPEAEQCDFHAFTTNVSAQDTTRLRVLQNALGYLLHGYKEELNARCVIFLDEVATTGKPDGRTGKSLLIRAVGELIKVTLIPGATFRFEDSFRFSRVDLDTRILYFDEWDGRRLPFKKLFTEIVSELAVNKKNQPEFIIPFADGPKFAMTTNDVLLGDGSSHEGRKLEIPLAPHYSATHTPKDEFGRGFFREGWETDVAEYNRFFNLALFWVQSFLASGRQLQQLPSATLAARKLEQETGTEFIEFAAELVAAGVPTNEPGIWAADAFGRYQTETGDRRTSYQRFNSWLVKLGFEKKKWRVKDSRCDQTYLLLPVAAANF
ncbi:BT4734/BF3469 family protein [Hymenobacter ginkgonis]|nr:BT4734/BF3469 family protein [Hymenobacter ginkgonis]